MKPDRKPNQMKRAIPGSRSGEIVKERWRASPSRAGANVFCKTWRMEFQERESSESPMLNAFCRVAPSVLRNFLAIFPAAVFFFAKLFNSRTSVAVHARRFFDFLAINPPFQERQLHLFNGSEGTQQVVLGFHH
jgi:hypothetical protein